MRFLTSARIPLPSTSVSRHFALEQEGISTIITAIEGSRKIFRRLESYIIYRLASSYLILAFFFLAIIIWDFEMQTWALVLISMFNDLAVMLTAFDKVRSQPRAGRLLAPLSRTCQG